MEFRQVEFVCLDITTHSRFRNALQSRLEHGWLYVSIFFFFSSLKTILCCAWTHTLYWIISLQWEISGAAFCWGFAYNFRLEALTHLAAVPRHRQCRPRQPAATLRAQPRRQGASWPHPGSRAWQMKSQVVTVHFSLWELEHKLVWLALVTISNFI